MSYDFKASNPENETIELVLSNAIADDGGPLKIHNWTEYSFTSDYLQPSSPFEFTIGDESLSDDMRDALKPGAPVSLRLNGKTQCTGYIDKVGVSSARDSGSFWRIAGRDAFGQVVDAQSDPTHAVKAGVTLDAIIREQLAPFGWSAPEHFAISDEADRDARSNVFRHRVPKATKKPRKKLTEYQLHQNRPYPNEGCHQFLSRLTQRFGLWLRCTSDGRQIIADAPDFDQAPTFELYRNRDGTTNVLEGEIEFDCSEQPTAIVADSATGSPEFGPGRSKAIMLNPFVRVADSTRIKDFSQPFDKYLAAGATMIEGPPVHERHVIEVPRPRILYLHDNESSTAAQLESFVRREMAKQTRRSMSARYTVEGHGQATDEGVRYWTPNTTVTVRDDVAGVDEVLWVLSRTFRRSHNGGTTTDLELIRLHSLSFSSTGR